MNQPAASNPSLFHRAAPEVGDAPKSEIGRDKGIVAELRRRAAQLRRWLGEIDRRIERERNFRDAVEHLESMSDAQLRDIGITRADIGDAVRFGRRYYVDR